MKLLLVEDEIAQREILAMELEELGHQTLAVGTGVEAVDALEKGDFEVAITDLNLPDFDGIEVIRRARAAGNDLPILVITAYASLKTAIAAIQVGATDYLIKPIRIDDLSRRLKQIEDLERLSQENMLLRRLVQQETKSYWLPQSAAGEHLMQLISKVGSSDLTVLVTGESGTGKGMTSRLLHSVSPRSEGAFVCVNCGAIPENLIESELFGYAKGAFTGATRSHKGLFAAASGGTLFLDEISNLTFAMQAKLLQAIEEKVVRPVGATVDQAVDVRFIVATNRSLEEMVKEGSFREDLFFRLNVFQILLPSLREQKEVLSSAVEYFLNKHSDRHVDQGLTLAPEVWDLFSVYDWPGNLRELENVIERALVLCEKGVVTVADLPPALQLPSGEDARTMYGTLKERVQIFERFTIMHAIEATGGDRAIAAEGMGISLSTLYRKLEEDL